MSLFTSNPIFQQYRNQDGKLEPSLESPEDESGDVVDLNAFKELKPQIKSNASPAGSDGIPLNSTNETNQLSYKNKSSALTENFTQTGKSLFMEDDSKGVGLPVEEGKDPLVNTPEPLYGCSSDAERGVFSSTSFNSDVKNERMQTVGKVPILHSDEHLGLVTDVKHRETRAIGFWEAVLLLRLNSGTWKSPIPSQSLPSKKEKSFRTWFSCYTVETADRVSLGIKLSSSLKKDPVILEDAIFADEVMKIPFSHDIPTHRRILLTVYQSVVAPHTVVPWWKRREKYRRENCTLMTSGAAVDDVIDPPMGHCKLVWNVVGFQGTNPATDLRSTGILGLLQLLYLIDFYPSLNSQFWSLCQGKYYSNSQLGGELPYVLISFNITEVAVISLQKGIFDATISSIKNGTNVVDVYARRYKRDSHRKPSLECPELQGGASEDISDVGTVGYCKFSSQEAALASQYPVITAVCEFYVGCVYQFIEEWVRLAKMRTGRVLSVSDFPSVKHALAERWGKEKNRRNIMMSTAKARFVTSSLFS